MGTRKNGRARRRHACLPRARPFSLSPTTSKRLLRRPLKFSQMFNLRCVTIPAAVTIKNRQLFKYLPLLSKTCFIFPPKLYSNSLFPFTNDIYCSKISSASKRYISKFHLISHCPGHSCYVCNNKTKKISSSLKCGPV